MWGKNSTSVVNTVIGSLVVLDLVLTVWGFFFTRSWFEFFHHIEHLDADSYLHRCAANWLAFFIIQVCVLVLWRKYPALILLVAGCRLGDVLTDVTCLLAAPIGTIYAEVLFPIAGVGNLVVGVYLVDLFFKKYQVVEKS